MKRGGVIHSKLSYAIATMGHDDLMIVTDAGLPIVYDERVIDLALTPNVPDIPTTLKAIRQEMHVEKYAFIAENANPNNVKAVSEIFPDAEGTTMPNDWFHDSVTSVAKWVLRTGGWTPWGNVALWAGIPVVEWFETTGAPVPDDWQERHARAVKYGHVGLD